MTGRAELNPSNGDPVSVAQLAPMDQKRFDRKRELSDNPESSKRLKTTPTGILDLPHPVLIHALFPFISIEDLLNFVKSCMKFLQISKDPRTWDGKKLVIAPHGIVNDVFEGGRHGFVKLHIYNYFKFQQLPRNITHISDTLKTLIISEFSSSPHRSLHILDILEDLLNLETLCLHGCKHVKQICWKGCKSKLQHLDLSYCTTLQLQDPNNPLPPSVTTLNVSYCSQVRNLGLLGELPNLHTLILKRCHHLKAGSLGALKFFNTLTDLYLDGCYEIGNIEELRDVITLECLSLKYLSSLTDVSPLADLDNLHTLDLEGCRNLQNVTPLGKIGGLTNLSLGRCVKVVDVEALKENTELHTLDLSLTSVPRVPLGQHPKLKEIKLNGCPNFEDATSLSSLRVVKEISLCRCLSLVDVSALATIPTLTTLKLSYCYSLLVLGDFRNLQHLNINYCTELDTSTLSKITSLKTLKIRGCFDGSCQEEVQNLTDSLPDCEITPVPSYISVD